MVVQWVYHEKQASLLCGQHCLNNLLQSSLFTPGDLAEIAQQLDLREREYMLEAGDDTPDALKYLAQESQNVDDSGNFSIEVLKMALHSFNIDLTPWYPAKREGYSTDDPCQEIGFIVNHASHWFTIRKISGTWWNLNSFQDRPEKISNFFLSAFLSQLVSDGYYVYIARGFVNDDNTEQFNSTKGSPHWHNMSQSNQKSSSSSNQQQQQQQPVFQGTGHKLGGQSSSSTGQNSNLNGKEVIALDLTEDEQLQLALSMSMEPEPKHCQQSRSSSTPQPTQQQQPTSQQSEKKRLREMRLAALQYKGG